MSIEDQINAGVASLSAKFKAKKFMSYFQAYTNTYKPVNELKTIYDSALKHPDIVGISIGTRPDCVDDEKLDLIAGYVENYETWVEYGLHRFMTRLCALLTAGMILKSSSKPTKKQNLGA